MRNNEYDNNGTMEKLDFATVMQAYPTTWNFDYDAFYPGDDYVDWMGISIFTKVQADVTGSYTGDAKIVSDHFKAFANYAQRKNKPIIIVESAAIEYGAEKCPGEECATEESGRGPAYAINTTDPDIGCNSSQDMYGDEDCPDEIAQDAWDEYYKQLFIFIKKVPNVKAICYANGDFAGAFGWTKNARIGSNEVVRQKFYHEWDTSIYEHANSALEVITDERFAFSYQGEEVMYILPSGNLCFRRHGGTVQASVDSGMLAGVANPVFQVYDSNDALVAVLAADVAVVPTPTDPNDPTHIDVL
jgi:hypothetical protein